MPMTSCPSRSSAASTRAPERSDTWRSKDRPPFSTATRLMMRLRAAVGGRSPRGERQHVGHPGVGLGGRAAGLGTGRVPVRVPYSPTCSCTTAPILRTPSRMRSSVEPEKLSRISEPPRPSTYAARPGTNATFARSARASRSVVSM